jgi:hypothetical protein
VTSITVMPAIASRGADAAVWDNHAALTKQASAENLSTSYPSLLRESLLAPDIVEAILDGRRAAARTLGVLMEPFPAEWEGQRAALRPSH